MASKREFELKLRRAEHHLHDLNREIKKWLNRNFKSLRQEQDPNRPNHLSTYVTVEPPPVNISLLTGDILHNLRGALDHLVYTLAERHSGPITDEKIAKRIEFPIFWEDSPTEISRRISRIHPGAQTVIQSLQPYQAGPHWAKDPLWILHELSNLDKHRLLLANALSNQRGWTHFSRNVTFGKIEVHTGYVIGKTKVATYEVRPIDPGKKMHVKYQPIVEVVFRCGCIVDRESVQQWLDRIHFYIAKIVIPKFDPFL